MNHNQNNSVARSGLPATFNGVVYNDFERINRTQTLLKMKLEKDETASRPGPGGSALTYIEGWRAMNLANEVFGFNGWSSEVRETTVDYIDQVEKGWNIGVSVLVRITILDGGVCREDVGYGKIENTKNKGDGLDKCKKEASTDAIKRALRQFGSLLGNCLYDKEYLKVLKNMKGKKPDLDWSTIHKSGNDIPNHTKEGISSTIAEASTASTSTYPTATKVQASKSLPTKPAPVPFISNRNQMKAPVALPTAISPILLAPDENDLEDIEIPFNDTLTSSPEYKNTGGSGELEEGDSGFVEASFFSEAVKPKSTQFAAPQKGPAPAALPLTSTSTATTLAQSSVPVQSTEQFQQIQERKFEAKQKLEAKQKVEKEQALQRAKSAGNNSNQTTPATNNGNKSAAPRNPLRPPQPPSRSTSVARPNLQPQQTQQPRPAPIPVQAGNLPTLNVGGGKGRANSIVRGRSASDGEQDSGLGVQGTQLGFTSASKMKRNAEIYDHQSAGEFESPQSRNRYTTQHQQQSYQHQQQQYQQQQPQYNSGDGSPVRNDGFKREPLSELEFHAGGEIKRPRLS